ncbi:MAG: lysine--tRNA ligase [Rhodospirillaceae bacterium]|nr:lysine--tRNA ligase [Rhodospirillaceae bacterium]
MPITQDIAENAKAWPFKEARELSKRLNGKVPDKGYVLFETGYGPSGLPHIGTFGEVVRTTMVRRAFEALTDMPTKLVAFSDDMDGLRKVPDNVPNKARLAPYAEEKDVEGRVIRHGSPLAFTPDPFGSGTSFAAANNSKLCAFLDQFSFDYDFVSATETYRSGCFNEAIFRVLENYEEVRNIVLPELGETRRKSYSPLFPVISAYDTAIGAERRQVIHNAIVIDARPEDGSAVFQTVDDDGTPVGEPFEHSVVDGGCKMQWRVDWALRWTALDVDYEMSGKDLIDSVRLGGRICRVIGGKPPVGFTYELFLDDKGEKISKSKGNGLAVEEWLKYAPQESLALFMYQQPKRAKRLFFDVIPKATDEYITFLGKFAGEDSEEHAENPVWHVHEGSPPHQSSPLSFSLLLNLACVVNAEDKEVMWGFISRYATDATPETHPLLDRLSGYAVAYYQDFVKPKKSYRAPTDKERAALEDLAGVLALLSPNTPAADIQMEIYEVGKRHQFQNLRDWFRALYEILLGQSQGPRMGSFIALYGIAEFVSLLQQVLDDNGLRIEIQ